MVMAYNVERSNGPTTINPCSLEETTFLTGDDVRPEEAVRAFLGDLALTDLAPGTIKQYSLVLGTFSRWLTGRRVHKIKHLRNEHARAWLLERKMIVRQWTLVQNRSILRAFFGFLRCSRLAPVDPDQIPHVATPKPDEVQRRRVSDAQVLRLFAGLRADYRQARDSGASVCVEAGNLLVFALLFGAGLRISEVAGARLSDLDTTKRELYVPHTKSNVPRYVDLPPSVTVYARLFLTIRRRCPIRSPYLFTSLRGRGIAVHTLAQRVIRLGRKYGVELTSHVGRRYCLTRLGRVNLVRAKKQAGHRNLETTLIYVEESREGQRAFLRENDPLR